MLKTLSKIAILFGILVSLNSCKNTPWKHQKTPSETVKIIHFSDSVLGLDSIALLRQLQHMESRHPAIFNSSDTSFNWERDLPLYLLDPEVQALFQDVLKLRIPLDEFAIQINNGVSQYKNRFTDKAKSFGIYTYISRNEKFWILEGPKHFFLPWDRYLGSDHPIYARDPAYQIQRHNADRIIIELFRALGQNHIPKNKNNSSLISAMIESGKSLLFIETILSESQALQALNISEKENNFLIENEVDLWKIILKNRWLFDNSLDLKRKLTQPAPFSSFNTPIDHKIPGQAGIWFGWKILKSYWAKNPQLTLREIMSNENVNLILQKSGYRP